MQSPAGYYGMYFFIATPVFTALVFSVWAVLIAAGRSRWRRAMSRRLILITGLVGECGVIVFLIITFTDSRWKFELLPAVLVSTACILMPFAGAAIWAALVRFMSPRSFATPDGAPLDDAASVSQQNCQPTLSSDPEARLTRDKDGTWHLLPPT